MQRKDAVFALATLAAGLGSPQLARADSHVPNLGKPLRPPARGPVNVGIVIGPDLVTIDAFGPAAAFGDAVGPDMTSLFNPYAIAATTDLLDGGFLNLQPQYTFANAPQPHVLVVPQQRPLPETIAYVKAAGARADATLSICTGAFIVAKAGLFDGLRATTHHNRYDEFERSFPAVTLVRGARYVEERNVSSSGGESSGIDLALRVVERYYGAATARAVAYNLEYRRTDRPLSVRDV